MNKQAVVIKKKEEQDNKNVNSAQKMGISGKAVWIQDAVVDHSILTYKGSNYKEE